MSCMNEMLNGRIIKGIGGFYYVETAKELYSCKARGVFRKKRITPLVGDQVQIRLDADGTGYIEEILPRKNFLTRPPVANIDQLIIVTSVCDPSPNPLLIDEAVAKQWHINPNWKLIAEMPFGTSTQEPGEKQFAPLEERILVFK